MARHPSKAVYLVSLGCPKNRIDSEAILGQLAKDGWRTTGDLAKADLAIVNTCGFLASAAAEARAEIAALARQKSQLGFSLAVVGCLVQRTGRSLADDIPAIDALAGIHSYKNIVNIITSGRCAVSPRPRRYPGAFYAGRQLTTGPGWAYLRIADGCDNRCAYCLIPSIRGPYRSRPMADIVAEARGLAARGVKELNLVAQDTTNYGIDQYGKRSLGRLLKRLDKVEELEWIRLLYTHPAHWDDGLIDDMAGCRKVARYVDLPLQHASDRILRDMGRRIGRRDVARLIKNIRINLEGVVLRTTFMVGFPGETEREFNELVDFAKDQRFDRMGCFTYSPEPGTAAAKLPGQVNEAIKQERYDRLMAMQQGISMELNRKRLGSAETVLVEGGADREAGAPHRKGYCYFGRSIAEAPEIDGKVYLRSDTELEPGRLARVKVDRAWPYDIGGESLGHAM